MSFCGGSKRTAAVLNVDLRQRDVFNGLVFNIQKAQAQINFLVANGKRKVLKEYPVLVRCGKK